MLRKQDSAVEVHAVKPGGAVARLRLRLQTAAGEPAARLERMALVENSKEERAWKRRSRPPRAPVVAGKFRIKRGDDLGPAEPGTGAGKLRVECPGRFVVLPDFFADDITIDATKLPLDAVDLPSENFVLHLSGDGDAIAMCVFENRQQDVKVTLAGAGDQRHPQRVGDRLRGQEDLGGPPGRPQDLAYATISSRPTPARSSRWTGRCRSRPSGALISAGPTT